VIRDVFSLRGLVRPGNSGGPIVDSDGEVAGVVFAASVTDGDTGYALTAAQVRGLAAQGATRTARVSTGGCA
jgi:S1-C subfamily serine protease